MSFHPLSAKSLTKGIGGHIPSDALYAERETMSSAISRRWYSKMIRVLCEEYRHSVVEYDYEEGTWIRISHFPLPPHFVQSYSRLLLLLPGINQPIPVPPKSFYLDKGLRTKTGATPAHVFDRTSYHGARDLSRKGCAYHCVLLRRWRPTADVLSGDNLITLLNTIRYRLASA